MECRKSFKHPISLLIHYFHKIPCFIWVPVSDSQILQSIQTGSMLNIFPEVIEEYDDPLSTDSFLY